MARTISMIMKTVKASTAKPNGKPPPRSKSLGIEPAILFYEIEGGDKTDKLEESEVLIMHDKSLVTTKKNLVKRKFPYINMFDHHGPDLVFAMRNLTVGFF